MCLNLYLWEMVGIITGVDRWLGIWLDYVVVAESTVLGTVGECKHKNGSLDKRAMSVFNCFNKFEYCN